MELDPSTHKTPDNSTEEKRQFIRQAAGTRAQMLGLTPDGVKNIQDEIDGLDNEQVEQRYSLIIVREPSD